MTMQLVTPTALASSAVADIIYVIYACRYIRWDTEYGFLSTWANLEILNAGAEQFPTCLIIPKPVVGLAICVVTSGE